MRALATCATALLLTTAACGGNDKKACDPTAQTGCDTGQVCEDVQGGGPACFAPVQLRGTVSDPTTTPAAPVNGARVVALDANRAPLSNVAVSAPDAATSGAWEVSVRATRDATGKPVQTSCTLRADKQGYQTFPGGVRTALPIDLSGATLQNGVWAVTSNLTALELLPLSNGGSAFLHGSVAKTSSAAGALVVAQPTAGGPAFTGVADANGDYAIYNLDAGAQYTVTAYAKGVNYVPATPPALVAGDNAMPTLVLGTGTGAALTGGLIFNNGANTSIQVTLVLDSTYVPNLDRGETPPGLTASGDASGYSFSGVPDGTYRVLAAFGLDGDVRSISGTGNTDSPVVAIQGGQVAGTPPSFKIIPAVDLLTIDGATVGASPSLVTTATPTFTWQKGSVDSSALTYRVLVFDSFGNEVWSYDMAAGTTDEVAYGADGTAVPLEPGMTYQLRILAIKEASFTTTFTQLSETEDVAGVFTYQP